MGRRLGGDCTRCVLNGPLLRERRVELGWTQSVLGAAVGISGAMVSLIEQGRRHVSASHADALASAVGLAFDEIVLSTTSPDEHNAPKPIPYLNTNLVVVANDEPGTLENISSVVASRGVNIFSLSSVQRREGVAVMSLVVDPLSPSERLTLNAALEALPSVHSSEAVTIPRPEWTATVTVPPGRNGHLQLVASFGVTRTPGTSTIIVIASDRVGLIRDLSAEFCRNEFSLNIEAVGSSVQDKTSVVWFMVASNGLGGRDGQALVRALQSVIGVQEVFMPSSLQAAHPVAG